jgi:hypothetical protein
MHCCSSLVLSKVVFLDLCGYQHRPKKEAGDVCCKSKFNMIVCKVEILAQVFIMQKR